MNIWYLCQVHLQAAHHYHMSKFNNGKDFASFQIKELEWIPSHLPQNCHLVVTTLTEDATFQHLTNRADTTITHMAGFNNLEDAAYMIQKYLSLYKKSLASEHLDLLLTSDLATSPAFLVTVCNELRVFGCHERLEEQLRAYAAVVSVPELWERILGRWSQEYGWSCSDKEGGGCRGFLVEANIK